MELEALGKARRRGEMKANVSMRTQTVKRVLSGEMASFTNPAFTICFTERCDLTQNSKRDSSSVESRANSSCWRRARMRAEAGRRGSETAEGRCAVVAESDPSTNIVPSTNSFCLRAFSFGNALPAAAGFFGSHDHFSTFLGSWILDPGSARVQK